MRIRQFVASLIILVMIAVAAPLNVSAQCGNLRHRHGTVWHTHRSCVGDNHKHGRSFWQKHRDKLTTAGGAVAGAAVGGLTGGRKGAAIGALVGAGGAAVYTYGIRKRRRPARHY